MKSSALVVIDLQNDITKNYKKALTITLFTLCILGLAGAICFAILILYNR